MFVSEEPIRLPFKYFLLQQPAFEVESRASAAELPSNNVPMVMRLLFTEADQVENHLPPQGGEFHSLARSIQPQSIEESMLITSRFMYHTPTLGVGYLVSI